MSSAGGGGGGAGSVPAFDTLSDKDSVSLHAHSVTASHVERTLSEVASSLSAPFPRPTGPQGWMGSFVKILDLILEPDFIQFHLICI